MGQCNTLASIGITVSAHGFAWVDAYVDFGCATEDNTPLLNVLVWK